MVEARRRSYHRWTGPRPRLFHVAARNRNNRESGSRPYGGGLYDDYDGWQCGRTRIRGALDPQLYSASDLLRRHEWLTTRSDSRQDGALHCCTRCANRGKTWILARGGALRDHGDLHDLALRP